MGSDTLFRAALGDRWPELHPAVQGLHVGGPEVSFMGQATIERGEGLVADLVCWAFGFPPTSKNIAVQVTKVRRQTHEQWSRRFGDHLFRSICLPSDRQYHVRERVGLMTFEQELSLAKGGIQLIPRRGWCLGLPLPFALLPAVDAYEGIDNGRFTFDIQLAMPTWLPVGDQLLVHYKGWLVPDDASSTSSLSPSSN
ncbi:MAG: DUF4166 domain-containing protein [Rhizobiales bacterium]|nr:DUF4166 domain-containing protein [Hyphomicrobiales bacterium]MBO6700582.1 DUF4166 domain-containing protein [Hyphomicrobiales bacterium]MBO6738118.1 DUF4166 domain-containing protein [Hyphomicrobiales bacterium]MBO6913575.1 DUF4166 domain-containing protein [Hyphomicrobiales bacterium]MBO6955256.1 DUF4166 domain-containing protein [Hyphomicrobiales bacterium]